MPRRWCGFVFSEEVVAAMTHLHLSFSCGRCCHRSHNWRSSHIISRVERSSQDDCEYAVFTGTDPLAKATEPSDTVENFFVGQTLIFCRT